MNCRDCEEKETCVVYGFLYAFYMAGIKDMVTGFKCPKGRWEIKGGE